MTSSGEHAIPSTPALKKFTRSNQILSFSSFPGYLTDLFRYISENMTFLLKLSLFLFVSSGI
jgi:hypothetical protein